ncbi:unnamed protein product [Mytilus edulis]|uniref:Peptidase A2 domain-containing protein n=1 Tax=Mytilus edulis TaxID=6550 RepID=A0A8S3RL73_MYTED|nr:unnamed protein product [Mytilus edulis]
MLKFASVNQEQDFVAESVQKDQGLSSHDENGQNTGADEDVILNTKEEIVIDRITAASIKVPMEVSNQKIKAVIDTGAEVTVLNEEIFFRLPKTNRSKLKPALKNLVVAEAGKQMGTKGVAAVTLTLGDSQFVWDVYVAPIGDDLLLGCDVLDEMDITVNSRKGIQLNGKWIECEVKRKSDLIARVVLDSNFTIPPSSEVILYGCGQNQELLDTRYSMIQPVIEDSRKFMVAQTLVDPFMKNIPVRLINLDSEPIRLKKNYLLGELHPVDYIENMFELENDRVDTLTSKQSKMCKTHELSKENFTLSETIEKANIPEKWESEIKICKINELNGKQKKKAENQLLPEHLKDLYERSSKDIESESIKEKLAEVLQKNICTHSTNSSEDTCKACEQINEQWKSFKTEVDDVKELNYKVTVRAVVTRSQEQSDWLAKYSVKEMQGFQKEDQDLKYLHQWKKEGKIPERELCASLSPATRRYWLNWENIELIDGIIYQKWINAKSKLNHLQLIVPQILKKDILVLSHNTPYSGHMGVKKTIEKMKTVFTWYKMSQDITEHIQNCTICNKIKGTGKKPKAPLMDYRVGYPLDRIGIDIIGPLTLTKKKNKFILALTEGKWKNHANAMAGKPLREDSTVTVHTFHKSTNPYNVKIGSDIYIKPLMTEKEEEFIPDYDEEITISEEEVGIMEVEVDGRDEQIEGLKNKIKEMEEKHREENRNMEETHKKQIKELEDSHKFECLRFGDFIQRLEKRKEDLKKELKSMEKTLENENICTKKIKRVQHGWDLFYTFGVPTVGHLNIAYTPRDAQVSRDTMKLISEYVRKGYTSKKSLKLERYRPACKSYNRLDYVNGKTIVTNELNFRSPRIDFWYKYLYGYENYKCDRYYKQRGALKDKMFTSLVFCLIFFNEVSSYSYYGPIRKTVYGWIRGKVTTRVPGLNVEEYLGMPYALPPIGQFRFKTRRQKLPVLLSIHGGSNSDGMGAMVDGDLLAAYGQIIVVTFNFRVSVLDQDDNVDHTELEVPTIPPAKKQSEKRTITAKHLLARQKHQKEIKMEIVIM